MGLVHEWCSEFNARKDELEINFLSLFYLSLKKGIIEI